MAFQAMGREKDRLTGQPQNAFGGGCARRELRVL